MSDARREIIMLMQETRTSQTRLARLLGLTQKAVGRWLNPNSDQPCEPPFYAINFLRCYIQLPEAARIRMATLDTAKMKRGAINT